MSAPVPEVSKRVEEGLLNKQLVYAREQCREPMERFVKCTNEVRTTVKDLMLAQRENSMD